VAFALASAFSGAALYIGLVEQPARLALDDRAMVAEWAPSDRRAIAMLGGLALIAAACGLIGYSTNRDVRWLVGSVIILASWPYMYFLLVPINNRLLSSGGADSGPVTREFMRDWGLLEWGLGAIGICAAAIFGWALS
jgi:hypothetical protein